MAQRRMFNKSITSSSRFIMMPPTSRLLYYDLGMNADDDGFCEHFVIMKMTDATPDDLRILQTRGLVKVFDDKVLIIRNWKENNYLQKDRYTPSRYLEEYRQELKLLATDKKSEDTPLYTKCIQDVDTGKVRIGKDSIGKVRIGKVRKGKDSKNIAEQGSALIVEIIKEFELVDIKNKTYYGNTTQRKACEFLIDNYGFEKVKTMIQLLPKTNTMEYIPHITTPVQLRDKWVQLVSGLQRLQNKQNAEPKVLFS